MPGGWTEYGNPLLPVSRAGRTHRERGKGRQSPSNSTLKGTSMCIGPMARTILSVTLHKVDLAHATTCTCSAQYYGVFFCHVFKVLSYG